jgi:hypothetical protein
MVLDLLCKSPFDIPISLCLDSLCLIDWWSKISLHGTADDILRGSDICPARRLGV